MRVREARALAQEMANRLGALLPAYDVGYILQRDGLRNRSAAGPRFYRRHTCRPLFHGIRWSHFEAARLINQACQGPRHVFHIQICDHLETIAAAIIRQMGPFQCCFVEYRFASNVAYAWCIICIRMCDKCSRVISAENLDWAR